MFKPIKINEIPEKRCDSPYVRIVKEFMSSDYDAVEVDLDKLGKEAKIALSNFRSPTFNYGCKAMIRQGRLFLVKEGVEC